jgi:hypothetical protein
MWTFLSHFGSKGSTQEIGTSIVERAEDILPATGGSEVPETNRGGRDILCYNIMLWFWPRANSSVKR